MKKKQLGVIGIEMIMVIVILLILVGWATARSDMMKSRTGTLTEASSVITIVENTRALTKSSSGYGASGTDLVPTLIQNTGVPKNLSVISSVIYNQFNGAITVVSTGTGFNVTDRSLPQDVCTQAAVSISRSNSVDTISINGSAAVTGEITAAIATSECNLAGKSNVIVFTSLS